MEHEPEDASPSPGMVESVSEDPCTFERQPQTWTSTLRTSRHLGNGK